MIEFDSYKEYKQHVYEMWEDGYINELEQDELILKDKEIIGENGIKTLNLRLLTENEYNEKYGK